MAITDLYVAAEEYLQSTNSSDTATTELVEEIRAAQDLAERELGVVPGAFNDYTGTVTLDGGGTSKLRLRDTDGRAFFLRSIDADSLKIDTDADGAYDDYTLDLDDAWVVGFPRNAAIGSEPYTAIELLAISSATVTRFPSHPASVQITGTLGWAAVPQLIKEIVISMTRDLRDHHTTRREADVGVASFSDQTWRLIKSAKERYTRRLPEFA